MLPRSLLPFHTVNPNNPLFKNELRHVRWASTEPALKRYIKWVVLGIPALVMGGWLIEVAYLNPAMQMSRFETVILIILFAAVGVMLLSSLYSIPAVIGPFTAHINAPDWDLMRLTPQSPDSTLAAADAVAQIRLWRLTAVEIGLRMGLVMWVIFTQFYRMYTFRADLAAFLAEVLHPFYWGFWLMLVIFSFALFIEPVIRTRLIIAINLAIAARLKGFIFAGLCAIFAVALVHAGEVLAIIIGLQIIFALARDPIGLYIIICIAPLALILLGVAILVCHWIRADALTYASNHTFKQN
ncbi:MAG: hypothetical protein LCI00_21305 [Chloroflexi bacterium]|nr:hypothetical protein [Chloroflexota bacterium]MCC6892352.1 hypothetical protein [Anaerolineae bacterium]